MTPTQADAVERLTVAILLGFTGVTVTLVGAFPSFPGTIAGAAVALITIVAGVRYDRSNTNTVRLEAAPEPTPAATDGGQEVEQ